MTDQPMTQEGSDDGAEDRCPIQWCAYPMPHTHDRRTARDTVLAQLAGAEAEVAQVEHEHEKTLAIMEAALEQRDEAREQLAAERRTVAGVRALVEDFEDFYRNRDNPMALGVLHAVRDFRGALPPRADRVADGGDDRG